MFFSGDFCHFPIDSEEDSESDFVPGSFCTSLSSIESRDSSGFPVCPHSHNFECLDEIVEEGRPRDYYGNSQVNPNQQTLCDVTFLVGPSLLPIYGLKAVMAERSAVLEGLFEKHGFLAPSCLKSSRRRPVRFFANLFKRKSKRDNSKNKPRLVISLPEHDPIFFDAFLTYIHTGCVNIDVSNIAGLLHLADVYKVDDLRKACWEVVDRCLSPETVIQLLTTSQRHAHCPIVAHLINTLLQHIDRHAPAVLSSKRFKRAPLAVAEVILMRAQLAISQNDRVAAILSWAKRHHRTNVLDLPATLNQLLKSVDFSRVTSRKIRREAIELGYKPISDIFTARPRCPARRELFPTNLRLRKHSPMCRVQSRKMFHNSVTASKNAFCST